MCGKEGKEEKLLGRDCQAGDSIQCRKYFALLQTRAIIDHHQKRFIRSVLGTCVAFVWRCFLGVGEAVRGVRLSCDFQLAAGLSIRTDEFFRVIA